MVWYRTGFFSHTLGPQLSPQDLLDVCEYQLFHHHFCFFKMKPLFGLLSDIVDFSGPTLFIIIVLSTWRFISWTIGLFPLLTSFFTSWIVCYMKTLHLSNEPMCRACTLNTIRSASYSFTTSLTNCTISSLAILMSLLDIGHTNKHIVTRKLKKLSYGLRSITFCKTYFPVYSMYCLNSVFHKIPSILQPAIQV